MEKSEHDNVIVYYPEVNGVRESPQQTAPDFLVSFWRNQWKRKPYVIFSSLSLFGDLRVTGGLPVEGHIY